MSVLAIIGWAWLLLGVICIAVFHFYVGITHESIKEEFSEIGSVKLKNPIPYYYGMMLLVGWVILIYITLDLLGFIKK